jgi:S-adenosylmethionine:tRNA ribosyltransferase-isomerase
MPDTAHIEYDLPPDLIASEPARPRDSSRLLVVDRKTQTWRDSTFGTFADCLEPGDTLVLNNTRVVNARLFGTLGRTGRRVEILFAAPNPDGSWDALLSGSRRIRQADLITLDDGSTLLVGPPTSTGLRNLRLSADSARTIPELLEAEGRIPLPPYIERGPRPADARDYQTVFASAAGAVAAPTAGLHFTSDVFRALRERRVEVVELTLHVGVGTFTPVRTPDPRNHTLQPERYEISAETAEALNRARAQKRRILAVGTTTTRTLEHQIAAYGRFEPRNGTTDLYILPGYRFQAIDGLLTNFHLPRSTLILLVAAFAGRDLVLDAYRHAIESRYRFYSYGDCCLFL